ncbi:MAG: hypothetical protein V1874_06615 [Spirochaetota bacterium]
MQAFNVIAFLFFFLILQISAAAQKEPAIAALPVYYPDCVTGSTSPYFIWYDAYNERDKSGNVKYRITLKPESGLEVDPVLIMPELFENHYYFKMPFTLQPDNYSYTIERQIGLKPSDARYYHYLKYPVTGAFEIDPDEKTAKDGLPPDKLIQYLRLEKENRLVNRDNFFFYSGAAAGAFGIGFLFYKVFHFGIISKIIYYIAFASSAAGVTASGYYGVSYLYERSRIADIGRGVSLSGGISHDTARVAFEMSY